MNGMHDPLLETPCAASPEAALLTPLTAHFGCGWLQERIRMVELLASSQCPAQHQVLVAPHIERIIAYLRACFKASAGTHESRFHRTCCQHG